MTRYLPVIAFVAVALLILGGMHYYVWVRLVRDPQLPSGVARLSTVALATMAVLLPLTLILSRLRDAPRVLVWISFLWMGIVFLLFAFLAIPMKNRLDAFEKWATAHNPFFEGPSCDLLALIPFVTLCVLLYLVGRDLLLTPRREKVRT